MLEYVVIQTDKSVSESKAFDIFIRDLMGKGVEIVVIEDRVIDGKAMLEVEEKINNRLENALMVTYLKSTIDICLQYGIACMAYESDTATEDLFGAKYMVLDFEGVGYSYADYVYRRHYKIPLIIAETERTIIREICIDDIDGLYGLYKNKQSVKYIPGLYEEREEELEYTRAYIKNMYTFYGYGMWIVTNKAGDIIGRAGFENRELDGKNYFEIGYLIGKKYRRNGIGEEVCRELLRYAKDELGMEKVYAFIYEKNRTSRWFAKKLGFVKDGVVEINGEKTIRYILRGLKKND